MATRTTASTTYYKRTTNLPTITGFTFCGWIRLNADKNDYQEAFTIGETAAGDFYGVGTTVDGTTLFVWNGTDATESSALTVGTWYHLALTCAGTGAGQLLVYLNGAQSISAAGNAAIVAQAMWLNTGNDANLGDWFNGSVAAVKIYDAVLTAQEILQEMRQVMPFRTANLVAWLPQLNTAEDGVDYHGVGNFTVNGTITELADWPPIPWRIGNPQRIIPPVVGGGPSVFPERLLLLGAGP